MFEHAAGPRQAPRANEEADLVRPDEEGQVAVGVDLLERRHKRVVVHGEAPAGTVQSEYLI